MLQKDRVWYGVGMTTDTIGGGLFAYLYLFDALGNYTSVHQEVESSRHPIDSPLLKCTETVCIYEAIFINESPPYSSSSYSILYSLPWTEDGLVLVPCLVWIILKYIPNSYQSLIQVYWIEASALIPTITTLISRKKHILKYKIIKHFFHICIPFSIYNNLLILLSTLP